jgi:hypothetical protein
MKKLLMVGLFISMIYACNSDTSKDTNQTTTTPDPNAEKIPTPGGDPAAYDPNRGEGKFSNVEVGDKLDVAMGTSGEKIYGVKCAACHKTTDEKLVGPGWKDVTKRHKPEWIMNFITNPDPMIDKDPKVQAQLEICLVRMPNQGLTDDDARHLLEFMRKNDGIK